MSTVRRILAPARPAPSTKVLLARCEAAFLGAEMDDAAHHLAHARTTVTTEGIVVVSAPPLVVAEPDIVIDGRPPIPADVAARIAARRAALANPLAFRPVTG